MLVLLFGCSTTKKENTYSASELFQQGKRLAKEKETEEAKEKIQLLMEDYPDSKERTAATMLLADIHYSAEEYEEAKFHYQKFIELYPAHQFVDRAHFYKSRSKELILQFIRSSIPKNPTVLLRSFIYKG